MELPSHSDADDTGGTPRGAGSPERNLGVTIVFGLLAAIVIIVIVLHLTGVVGPLSK